MANPWDQDPPEDSVQNPWDADPPSDTVVATAPSIPPSGYLTEDQNPPGVIDWLVNFLKGTYRDSGVPITNPQAEMPGYVAGKQASDIARETSPYILAGAMTGGAAAPLLTSGTIGGIGAGAAIEGLSQGAANVLNQVLNQTDNPLSMVSDIGMGAAFSGVPVTIAKRVGPEAAKIIDEILSSPAMTAPPASRVATPEELQQLSDVKSPVNMIDNAPPVTYAPDASPAPVSPAKQPTTTLTLYHGTNADNIGEFKSVSKSVNSTTFGDVSTERHGIFFSDNPNFAKEYGENVGEMNVRIENPAEITPQLKQQFVDTIDPFKERELWLQAKYSKHDWGLFEGELGGRFVKFLKDEGFDGAKFYEEIPTSTKAGGYVDGTTWVALDSKQVVSRKVGSFGDNVSGKVPTISDKPPVSPQGAGDVTLGAFGGIDDATIKDIAAKGEKLAAPIKAPDAGTPIERFGLSEVPDNPGIGERVYRNLSRWAGKVIPGIAQQPVKRIETMQGQAILHAFDDTRGRIDAFRNVLTEKIDNIFKTNPGLTAEQIRSGNAPAVKELTDALYVTAKEYGLDPNYVRNYLTQVTLPKYANKLESGMDKLRAQLGPLLEQRNMDLANNTSVAAAEYPRAIEAAIAQADPVIKEATNYLVESGQVKNVVEAFEVLGARTEEAGLDRFGFKRLFRMPFEKARGYKLPPNFYEQDAKKLLNIYADETSKRIPLARAFGANGEKLQAAIDKIATYNPKEAAYISKVSDIFTGKAEQAGGWGAFGRGLSHLVIAGKIGTGLSTVANAFQTLSLTMGKAGAYRMVKGLGMMFTDAGKEIGTKVAGKARTYEEMFGGLSDKSLLGKLSHSLTTATGFNHTNYFNLFYSANVFKPFVEDLAKASKSSVGARARWAQQELADLGINWQKGMTDDQLVAAVHKLSFDSQLMERITNSPMILNDPRWRPLFLLKKYTINQAIAAKDLIGQELSRGNALPIVRLAAGGILGGEVAIEAKNRLTSLLSGEKKYRKEDDWYERVANDLAAVGTMGWLTDMFGADNPQQLGNNITRFITPAALDIAGSAVEEGVTVAKRAESVGAGPALRKEAGDIAGVIGGGLAKTAVQRAVETPGDVAERTRNRRDVEKAAINDLFVKGENDAAQKRIALWNENNPEYGFKGKEFTNKGIKKIIKKRAEKKYEAEQ